jgi:putative endonuclease
MKECHSQVNGNPEKSFKDCHSRGSGNPETLKFYFRRCMKTYYVYILASKRNGTLYIGVTNDLIRRIYEHKDNLVPGFTDKYGVHKLVYYERVDDIQSAIEREKQLEKWSRRWKLQLIESANPYWKDLYDELQDPGFPPPRE